MDKLEEREDKVREGVARRLNEKQLAKVLFGEQRKKYETQGQEGQY